MLAALVGAVAVLSALASASTPLDAGPPDLIQPELLAEDVAQLMRILEEVHPDPYYHLPRPRADEATQTLLSSLDRPLSRAGFFSLLARFTADFQDGHFAVAPPNDHYRVHVDGGGLLFPFDVRRAGERLLIEETYGDTGAIGPGDRIVSINGHAADSLFSELSREQSGEPRYRDVRARYVFRLSLWNRGIRAPFVVGWMSAGDDRMQRARLTGATGAEILEKRARRGSHSTPYAFAVLDERIGLIDFTSMRDGDAFTSFLQETFTQCRDDSLVGLIVDLRRNGGGDSRLGDELLSYITGKPYRMAARKEWKVSQSYKDYLRTTDYRNERYLNSAVGDTLLFELDAGAPPENPLRFEGPVCFLIGAETYSSAVMLANAVEDYDLAMLIGEESGGRPNGFGETMRFALEHSGLEVDVSSAMWIRASGDRENKRGVMPDIPVADSRERDEVDAAIQRAREWILAEAGTRSASEGR